MMPSKDDRLELYSRSLALRDFDMEDLDALEKTTITVLGAGGLGCPALRLLTAIGFGKIRIIDHDIVELSNLQRQTVYNYEDIGSPKVHAAATNLAKQNPFVEFEPVAISVTDSNALDLLRASDIILDGLDSMTARRAVNQASYSLKVPYIYAGALEYYANISTFIPDDTGCLYCLVGDVPDNPENTCATVGVSPPLLSIVAAIEVREAVLLATGRRPMLAGQLMHVDLENLGFDTFGIARSQRCPVCSSETSPSAGEESALNVTMMCTNSFSISPARPLALDLAKLSARLKDAYRVTLRKTSLIIRSTSGASLTLMSTGAAVVKGVTGRNEAVSFYRIVVS
jgi:molybdopterin/thiamine biosynthesis adenylyltransferase